MGCTVRTNRHGYLAFRLYWEGNESHEGTKLKDTPGNRSKVEARARVIDQEMRDATFDYLHWFPNGHLAYRFRPATLPVERRLITVRGFFRTWGKPEQADGDAETEGRDKQTRLVSLKWALNRASTIKTHVLPALGPLRLDEITPAHLADLQRRMLRAGKKPATIDSAIHSALRALLRDARSAGYAIPDLRDLYDRDVIQRLDRRGEGSDREAFTEDERDVILKAFLEQRGHYHAFVMHQFWTGARPSEAVALRRSDVDLTGRRILIRRGRVLGQEGRPKTGSSKRDVVIHENLLAVLREHLSQGADDDFVFTTPSGAPIDQTNFYNREWVPMLKRLGIRPRDFYACRHTYISYMIAIGASPLFVHRQTGTSLEMIEKHYGNVNVVADEMDELISDRAGRKNRNPTGTPLEGASQTQAAPEEKPPTPPRVTSRAGDRGRTGDVQLGKLAFYR